MESAHPIEMQRPLTGLKRWIKEPYCGLSHAFGALLSIIAMVSLLMKTTGGAYNVVAIVIYGVSMITLYVASAVVHSVHCSPRTESKLDCFDYSAIFCMIAGTYTAICLTALRGPWGWTLFGIEWGLAVIGIVGVFLLGERRKYMVILYLPMGWLMLAAIVPAVRLIPSAALMWLLAGGIIYSLGAIVFATKQPRLWPGRFGSHDLWHTMVLLGSACHFMTVFYTTV